MLTYQVEPYSAAIGDMRKLYTAHWLELGTDHDKIPLAMNYARYEQMDQAGVLHLVTVRDDAELIGYYLSMVFPHLHYMNVLTSFGDIMFLKPEYRKGFTGVKLLKFTEARLHDIGVRWIFSGSKLHHNEGKLGKLLELLGYTPRELVYTKILED